MAGLTPDDCYRDLVIPFFDGAMVARLSALCERRIGDGDFIRYDDYKTPEEFSNVLEDIPEIGDFAASAVVGCRPLLMFLPPGFSMAVHRDLHWGGNRQCSIVVMAYPLGGIAPTNFYLDESRDSLAVSSGWHHGQCKLLNIKQWHNVDNAGTWRANLQLSIDTDYRDVVGLIGDNALFRGHDCGFTQTQGRK